VFEKTKPSPRCAIPGSPSPLETFSYYGPLNFFTYNVGLHNEHHDFPAIPWTRLPKLREIASEFYERLPQHTSWTYVFYQFIFDSDVSLWSRVKREKEEKSGRKVEAAWTKDEIEGTDEAALKRS
jgi:sphingolipid delta-4 desaturase